VISDIVSLYKSRGLRGPSLRAALERHAKILAGLDAGCAQELRVRAGILHKTTNRKPRPKRKAKPSLVRLPTVDEARARWMAFDRKAGL
jgi:hypothetical protein